MSDIIIGIDLGTTNSEVAVMENGSVTIVPEQNDKIVPSFVGLDNEGNILVGQAAKNQYQVYPERTIRSIKRKMGRDIRVDLGANSYTPQEVSAIILKKLKTMAENYLGCAVHKAVITVPAYFSDAQRQATREAGEIAGLEVVKMINEPTAAALSYESAHKGSRRIMVYDLGGGTFDVSVVEVQDDVIEVVASHGNNHLGGDDFDNKIVEHVLARLKEENDLSDEELPLKTRARIERAAEAAKKILSDEPFATIAEEYLLEKDGVPINLNLELARRDYEEMIMPYVEETLEAIHIALNSAGLTASDIEEVLLVGGSTRTPLVRNRLEEEFGFQPRSEINPDLCVATGAAMQAAMIKGDKISSILVDITPYTFGTSAFEDLDGMPYPYVFVPIIKKNTPVPVTKSEVFYTMVDNQQKVECLVFQGENLDAMKNIKIGEFLVEGLSRVPMGNQIIVSFELDKDGILHVTAKEKKTGLQKKISIDNAMSRFDKEELDLARNRIASLFGDEQEQADEQDERAAQDEDGEAQTRHAFVRAKALIEKAERLFDTAEPEDREEMVGLIEQINDAIKAADSTALEEPMDTLSDIIYYLES